MYSHYRIIIACVALFALHGCSRSYGVRSVDDTFHLRQNRKSALTESSVSLFSKKFLRQHLLDDSFHGHRLGTINGLIKEFAIYPDRDAALVISELCFSEAGAKHSIPEKRRFLLTSAIFAYSFLFDDELISEDDIFSRQFRLGCDLYNHSLSQLITLDHNRLEHWEKNRKLESLIGPVIVNTYSCNLPWPKEEYDDLLICHQFEVLGLNNHSKRDGIGVPLIVTRSPRSSDPIRSDDFLPNRILQAFPATLTVTFKGALPTIIRNGSESASAAIEIHDTLNTSRMRISESWVPLAMDFTTPIAYVLDKAPPVSGFQGFFDVAAWENQRGLYMLHPYQRGKIPVVLVHGLLGKPQTWIPMVNDLLDEPTIRKNYQFWYFRYATGNPLAVSASILREDLKRARQRFDPDGTNPKI